MTQPSDQLLAPTFLFRFAVPCHSRRTVWGARGVQLAPKFRIPSFGALEKRPLFADVRGAWNRTGLSFTVRVAGKKLAPKGARALEVAEGLHVWIDTRHTQDVHRASRYCHHFLFARPAIASTKKGPAGQLVPIARAKEHPRPSKADELPMVADRRVDGYRLAAHISADSMTGFDPLEHPRLGFSYAVVDGELGWQTFSTGPEFPFPEDPSLWGILELTGE